MVSVTCSPSSWCALWPSELVNGRAAEADFDTATYCLWEPGVTRGTASELVSKWSSPTGTTWMCPEPGGGNQVNGSWLYINNAETCIVQTGQAYPCPNNTGPYYNGIQATLGDGGGLVITQWEGWNFVPPSHVANGRSIFGLPTPTGVYGMFCVYDDSKEVIEYCFPEPYTVVGKPTQAECNQYDRFPAEFAKNSLSVHAVSGGSSSEITCDSEYDVFISNGICKPLCVGDKLRSGRSCESCLGSSGSRQDKDTGGSADGGTAAAITIGVIFIICVLIFIKKPEAFESIRDKFSGRKSNSDVKNPYRGTVANSAYTGSVAVEMTSGTSNM